MGQIVEQMGGSMQVMPATNENTAGRKQPDRDREIKRVTAVLAVCLSVYCCGWVLFHGLLDNETDDSVGRGDLPTEDGISSSKVGPTSNDLKKTASSEALTKAADRAEIETGWEQPFSDVEKNETLLTHRQLEFSEVTELSTSGSLSSPEAQPDVSSGQAPVGISLDDKVLYTGCWDSTGIQYPASKCDALDDFFQRFNRQLQVVDSCRLREAGENTFGTLNLGAEIDLVSKKLSLWNNPSSDMRGAVDVARCLANQLSGLSVSERDARFARYQLSFSIRFARATVSPAKIYGVSHSKKIADLIAKGRSVSVIKDRVRVRTKPIDGAIIGRISSGNNVILLEQKDGWCSVETPRHNIGWMICWALEL